MPGSTSRLALPYPLPADPNNVPSDVQALATQLDSIGAAYALGVETARPAFGIAGRFYISSDSGKLFVDNGTAWSQVNYSPTQLFSTKGDLLIASAAMEGARLGAGADGQALVSRSAATLGVDWETVVGQALELTGATAATRYVGGTVTGAPTTGTFALGDFIVTQDAEIWVCTVAGTPGTWTSTNKPSAFGVVLIPNFTTPTRDNANITAGGGFNSSAEIAYPFTVANNQLIKNLVVDSGTPAQGSIMVGIRSSIGGLPGTLLANTARTNIVTTGTMTLPLTNGGVSLTPGAMYWIVFLGDGVPLYLEAFLATGTSITLPFPAGTVTTTGVLALADNDPALTSTLQPTFGTANLGVIYSINSANFVPHVWLGA